MVALRFWWGNPDPEVRSAVVAIAERAAEREDDPVLLHVLALADPVGRGSVVRARVAQHAPDQTNPVPMLNLGYAANATYSDDLAPRSSPPRSTASAGRAGSACSERR